MKKEAPAWFIFIFSILSYLIGRWLSPVVAVYVPFPLGQIGELVVGAIGALILLIFLALVLYILFADSDENAKSERPIKEITKKTTLTKDRSPVKSRNRTEDPWDAPHETLPWE